jgi:PleD family two-component response regulator
VSRVCSVVTVSVGVACFTPEPRSPADGGRLVGEADRLLYLAKQRGRNLVVYAD